MPFLSALADIDAMFVLFVSISLYTASIDVTDTYSLENAFIAAVF